MWETAKFISLCLWLCEVVFVAATMTFSRNGFYGGNIDTYWRGWSMKKYVGTKDECLRGSLYNVVL